MENLEMCDDVKLVVYVPETHKEVVKNALFAAGAGAQGEYDQCAFETRGTGQFRPSSNAQPHLGQANELSQVSEWRVEMLVARPLVSAVVSALQQAHPYEEPAFDILPRYRVS